MIKYEQGAAKKLSSIPTVRQRAIPVKSKTQERNEKGTVYSVSVKTTPTDRFIDLVSEDLLVSSGQISFTGAVYYTIDRGTEW